MSSEREKLIEIWLDSAGERQYQFAFRNALLSAGYTILHDTSHAALELGKDILAVSPSGELMAYQLKGNPGGRITISQWQGLLPQINTLVYQPPSHPMIKAGTMHTPVLVTNGEIHEDVYAAITAYNATVTASLPKRKPLQTIARGQMLKMILESADTLWPVDIQLQRNVLNVFVAAGDDELPIREFIDILNAVLTGRYADTAIPSVHLVTSILASNWIAKENHFELVRMYVLLAVASVCYQSRWAPQRRKDRRFLEEILFEIRVHLRNFVDDLARNYRRGPLLNGDLFSEFAYFHPRKKVISGLASAALLDPDLTLAEESRDFLWQLVVKTKHSRFLLWEGLVPYCLAEFWALSSIQGTKEPDRRLYTLLNDILNSNDNENPPNHLPGPYYSLSEVVRWRYEYRALLQTFRSSIDQDSHYRRSWFAEPLFFLLVRRNYKSACKSLWPLLTKFIHVSTRLPGPGHFGPARCETAVAEDKIIDLTRQRSWDDVVVEAGETSSPIIPRQLLARPALVLLYCLFVPQRMTRDVILWLDRAFCKSWH